MGRMTLEARKLRAELNAAGCQSEDGAHSNERQRREEKESKKEKKQDKKKKKAKGHKAKKDIKSKKRKKGDASEVRKTTVERVLESVPLNGGGSYTKQESLDYLRELHDKALPAFEEEARMRKRRKRDLEDTLGLSHSDSESDGEEVLGLRGNSVPERNGFDSMGSSEGEPDDEDYGNEAGESEASGCVWDAGCPELKGELPVSSESPRPSRAAVAAAEFVSSDEESDPYLEAEQWQVVHRPGVNIRARPDTITARIVGKLDYMATVLATRDGDWIRLEDGTGFVLIPSNVPGSRILVERVKSSSQFPGKVSQ